jgi:hypothetical protein
MKKKLIINITIVLIIISLIIITACKPSEIDTKKALIVGKILKENKIPYTAISSNNDKIEIIYETSDATNYDAQMINDWGMIFSAAANFDYKEIIIVNTINHVPTVKLTSTSENVKLLGNGWINESEFFENIEIKAIK